MYDCYREQMSKKGTNYNSEAVRNLDIWSIELNVSFRGGMRAWNRTVQFWLANYVYKRVPRSLGYRKVIYLWEFLLIRF